MRPRILLIDDEDVMREDLARLLAEEGFECETAPDGQRGLELVGRKAPDLVLCDLVMPGMSGVEVVERLSALHPETSVIVITAFGTMETAVEAFRHGAADYLLKPLVPEELSKKIRRCLEEQRLRREIRDLRRAISQRDGPTTIVGDSASMQEIRRLIDKVAPAATSVLLSGETGTGKELVARALHEGGRGQESPFIAVNCSAIPRELFESELFGHVRGAFTGAAENRRGYFELANGGTLFLDEVSELSLDLQPKLLRALESGEIRPVGRDRTVSIDVRVVAATNRDLEAETAARRFRADLYYRLRVLDIHLPALRQRREDIPPLVDHLLQRLNSRLGRRIVGIDEAAIAVLMSAPWKGNVRELENVLERAVLLTEGERLGVSDLPAEMVGSVPTPGDSDNLREAVQAFEAHHIRKVLESVGQNREQAARKLGLSPATLYRRLQRLKRSSS